MTDLSILDYTDYRTFLIDYCNHKRQAEPGWSVRKWTHQLGMCSPSTFTMIIKGRRSPRLELARRMSKTIEFNLKEENYFLDLIRLEKVSRDPNASVLLMENLAKTRRSVKYKHLDHRTFAALSQWHCVAIKDMVHLATFREDPDWIASHLSFPITPAQAREALDILKRHGLIARVRGRLQVVDEHLDTSFDISDEAIKSFHEQALKNAGTAIRKFGTQTRECIGTTFAFNKRDLQKAKEMLRNFELEFCKVFERDRTDSVYHLEIVFHPVAEGDVR